MPSHHSYLEAQVFTSSQPQLQLMLLERAVRYGRQALQVWEQLTPEADRLLQRTTDLVEGLVHGVAAGKLKLSQRLEEQYAFLFRELVDCRINRDVVRLEKVLKLLEFERDTWIEACKLCQDTVGESNRTRSVKQQEAVVQQKDEPQDSPGFRKTYPNAAIPTQAIGGGLSLEA